MKTGMIKGQTSFFVSLVFHLGLFLLFRTFPLIEMKDKEVQKEVVELDFLEVKTKAPPHQPHSIMQSKDSHSHKASQFSKKRTAKKSQVSIQIADLLPSSVGVESSEIGAKDHLVDPGQLPDETRPWGGGSMSLSHLVSYNSYRRLHEKIQSALIYPHRLGRNGISGSIYLRVLFKEKQCLQLTFLDGSGEGPMGVYIRRLFEEKICTKSYLEHVLDEKEHGLDFAFVFKVVETTQPVPPQIPEVAGNSLTFFRTYPKSVLQWNLGPLTGVWGVPYVSLDLAWFERDEKS